MGETLWTNRSPGQLAAQVEGEPETVLHARFIDSDWLRIPAETPAPGGGLHPFAGKEVRVSRRFYSWEPQAPGLRMVAHLWSVEAGLGVAETSAGFVCYTIESWPDGWPMRFEWERPRG